MRQQEKTCHKRVKGRSSLSGLGGSPIRVWGGSPKNLTRLPTSKRLISFENLL
ncbi:MAG: hypothetical protein RR327_08725 [Clostridia bacterium]